MDKNVAFSELNFFDKRVTAKIDATLKYRPMRNSQRTITIGVVPYVKETVAQFAARVVSEHCESIEQATQAVVEIRVAAEKRGE